MQKFSGILSLICFAVAVLAAFGGARLAVSELEARAETDVRSALVMANHEWAQVQADGLNVVISGTAPSEADRFRAKTTAGTIVDAARLIDSIDVPASKDLAPPRFAIEILRNDDGVSLIGLVPADTLNDSFVRRLHTVAPGQEIANFLNTAAYPAPEGWDAAVKFALTALEDLHRSKISVAADRVSLTAIVDTRKEQRQIEARLARTAPSGVRIETQITAPRPVITPFALRFSLVDDVAAFETCSAPDAESSEAIILAARQAGLEGKVDCTEGLGTPSPDWAKAAARAIAAVAELKGGRVTFSDADVTLKARQGTAPAVFDRVVGELEADLPKGFALRAILPDPPAESSAEEGPPEFTATLSPEGQVQLRGRVSTAGLRETADSLARARFGSDKVYSAARVAQNMPNGWSVRVLTAIEALAELARGKVLVQPDSIVVTGQTGNAQASTDIAELLSTRLGQGQQFEIAVKYNPLLDPLAGIPSPQECADQVNRIVETRKITFEPGSGDLSPDAQPIIDALAEVLKDCAHAQLEVAGHTDSQGREVMNQQLSQLRADAVVAALQSRRILTSNLRPKGYGEAKPIADNRTEDGREANRRIEFTLLTSDAPASDEPAEDTTDEQTPDAETQTDTTETPGEQN